VNRDGFAAGGSAPVQVIPLTDAAAAALCTLAASLDMNAARIDLAGCADKASFLERTAEALSFPAWFGGNWDAFFDCLTDLGWLPGRVGHVLVFERTDAMRRESPEALDTAITILGDAAAAWESRGVPFRAYIAGPSFSD
jgi:RNAse (barnase) inhibitor barstar